MPWTTRGDGQEHTPYLRSCVIQCLSSSSAFEDKNIKGYLHVGVGTGGLVGPIPTRGPAGLIMIPTRIEIIGTRGPEGFELLSNHQATDFRKQVPF